MVLKKNRSCLKKDWPSQSHSDFSTVLKYLEKELLKSSWADLHIFPTHHLQILKTAFSLETVRKNNHPPPFWMFFPKYIAYWKNQFPLHILQTSAWESNDSSVSYQHFCPVYSPGLNNALLPRSCFSPGERTEVSAFERDGLGRMLIWHPSSRWIHCQVSHRLILILPALFCKLKFGKATFSMVGRELKLHSFNLAISWKLRKQRAGSGCVIQTQTKFELQQTPIN